MGTAQTYIWILLGLTKRNSVSWPQRPDVKGGMTHEE